MSKATRLGSVRRLLRYIRNVLRIRVCTCIRLYMDSIGYARQSFVCSIVYQSSLSELL